MEERKSVIQGLRGTIWSPTKFDKVTRFTLSVSRKDKKTDKWQNGYLNCVVMNDIVSHELQEKMRVEIDGDFVPNEWQTKDGKIRHDIQIWVNDLKFTDGNSKAMDQVSQENEEVEDILPFT